jgi:nucleotide-binding universal stress UspA family protein
MTSNSTQTTARSDRTASQRHADRIVVGYDGSDEAATAVRWAAGQASRTSSRLCVVWAWRLRNVWDGAVDAHEGAAVPPVSELEEIAREHLAAAVDGLVGDAGLDPELRVVRGPAAAEILLHAARDAELLVLGSRGRGRVADALLGSVTNRCIRDSACPVVVIPHPMVESQNGVDPDAAPAEAIVEAWRTSGFDARR